MLQSSLLLPAQKADQMDPTDEPDSLSQTMISTGSADIESITILKNAAETAQYGSRGANGVIEVKTK